MPSLDKRFTLIACKQKYFFVCKQIDLLEKRLTDLKQRRKMAKKRKKSGLLSQTHNDKTHYRRMLFMYNFYAIEKLDEIAKLRQELFGVVDQSVVESEADMY